MMAIEISGPKRQEISEALNVFGLAEREQSVYLALLSLGRTTLSPLARASGLKLTTAQAITARLAEQGLMKVTKRGSRGVYEAIDPVILRRLLERRTETVAGVIPLLQEMRGAVSGPAKIRVFERDRMKDIFRLAAAARGKMVYEIVAAKDLQDILGESFHFTARRVKAGVYLKSLRVEDREIKKYSLTSHVRELREARFLPRELTFNCSIMFWDDTVAFFTTKGEGLAWTIKSASLFKMQSQMFDLLWSLGRKMETG
jgi:sugar-specific transcriptional regulator TrmB